MKERAPLLLLPVATAERDSPAAAMPRNAASQAQMQRPPAQKEVTLAASLALTKNLVGAARAACWPRAGAAPNAHAHSTVLAWLRCVWPRTTGGSVVSLGALLLRSHVAQPARGPAPFGARHSTAPSSQRTARCPPVAHPRPLLGGAAQIRTAVSSVCFQRNIFPDGCFKEKVLAGRRARPLTCLFLLTKSSLLHARGTAVLRCPPSAQACRSTS